MADLTAIAHLFEQRRHRLRAVAYRLLGSFDEADDAVQEAWLRLNRSDAAGIQNFDGWLTTVLGHVCLDMLRSRRARKEESIESYVPDLILSPEPRTDPEQEALIADSVGIALLIVLETLSPGERLAFVLHDMFALPFDDIAPIVGGSTAAARQMASRARRRVRGAASVPDVDVKQQRKVVDAFFAAVREGNFDALLAVLDPEIVLRSDHGPVRELRGAPRVAQGALMFSNLTQAAERVLVNGVAGVLSRFPNGEVFSVLSFIVRAGKIAEIHVFRNPDRLRRLDLSALA